MRGNLRTPILVVESLIPVAGSTIPIVGLLLLVAGKAIPFKGSPIPIMGSLLLLAGSLILPACSVIPAVGSVNPWQPQSRHRMHLFIVVESVEGKPANHGVMMRPRLPIFAHPFARVWSRC